jgi:hypothetical protein
MDFKIAGTRKGVTSIQLDIKPAGIPLDILCQCLDPAFEARKQILDFMEREISDPREQSKQNSPRLGKYWLLFYDWYGHLQIGKEFTFCLMIHCNTDMMP